MSERYGRALEHNATVNTAAADKALASAGRSGEMSERKRLTAEERIYARQLFGRVVQTAADDPLDIAEEMGQKLLGHIAWQDGEMLERLKVIAERDEEIARLKVVVEAARDLAGYWQTHEIEPMIHHICDALAALDAVEVKG